MLMIGRERVVAEETMSHICSARWEKLSAAPEALWRILPLPTRI